MDNLAGFFFFFGLVNFQCWSDVVSVEELFVGLVGVAVVNGCWTCLLLELLVLNLSSCS